MVSSDSNNKQVQRHGVVFTVKDGRFIPLPPDDPLFDVVNGICEPAEFEAVGYGDREEVIEGVEIHTAMQRHAVSDRWQYALIWSPTYDTWAMTLCEHSGQLADAMKVIEPYLLLNAIRDPLDVLSKIASKQFRATHGHHWLDACRECDPETVKQMQEARRRRDAARQEVKAS